MEIYNSIDRRPREPTNMPIPPTHNSRFFTNVTTAEATSEFTASLPPWTNLLQESPGRMRPYYNWRTHFEEQRDCPDPATDLKPLSPIFIMNENRGSQIDLGKHRGARLKNRLPQAFYTPERDEGVWLEDQSGDWKGASASTDYEFTNGKKSNPGCAEKESGQRKSAYMKIEEDNANADNDSKEGTEATGQRLSEKSDTNSGNSKTDSGEKKTWTLLQSADDYPRIDDYRSVIDELFELQFEQHMQRKVAAQKELARKKNLKAEQLNAENAVSNQEKLDRRPPWSPPDSAPGAGEKHPVLDSPAEGSGVYNPLLFGIFTDNGKTLPPHFTEDYYNEAGKKWENVNRFTDVTKPVNIYANSRKHMSAKEKMFHTKLIKTVRAAKDKDREDAIKNTVGHMRRERIEKYKDTEYGKWMRDQAGEIERNTFFYLCGGMGAGKN